MWLAGIAVLISRISTCNVPSINLRRGPSLFLFTESNLQSTSISSPDVRPDEATGNSPDQETTEQTSLLDPSHRHQNASNAFPSSRRTYLVQQMIQLRDATKAVLTSSVTNWFLPVVPVAIISESMGWGPVAVFLLNFFAMLPLASLLSYSTEELASNVGQVVGGLINATCGNLVELIVSSKE